MTLDLRTHIYRRDKRGGMVLIRAKPYLRLNVGMGPPIYVQEGRFFPENGPELDEDDLPPWTFEELAKTSQEARNEVGLGSWQKPASSPTRRGAPTSQPGQASSTVKRATPQTSEPTA